MSQTVDVPLPCPVSVHVHALWHRQSLHLCGLQTGDCRSALDPQALRALLGELSADALAASVAAQSTLTLWLPSGETEKPLATMTVPTLALAPTDAVDWLTSLPAPAPEACGPSVAYWARLASLILRHVANRQFFPDIQTSGDTAVAVWRLLVSSTTEVQNLERYARAMPPICRAVEQNGDSVPVSRDASALLESFLVATTDAVIRRSIAADPFFAEFSRRDTAPDQPLSPERRWVAALVGHSPHVPGTREENAALQEQVKTWVRPLDHMRASPPVQLRLTLEEPFADEEEKPQGTEDETQGGMVLRSSQGHVAANETPPEITDELAEEEKDAAEDHWTIRLQVIPLERDSNPIDAEDLWAKDTIAAGVLSRNILDWRQRLKSELARAAEVCPPFERLAAELEPTCLRLSTLEAHTFIHQWAPALRQRSFIIMLPDWATRPERDLGLLLYLAPPVSPDLDQVDFPDGSNRGARAPGGTAGHFGLHTLLNFDWRIAVGDMQLSADEFRVIAEQGAPLVRHKGQWLQFSPDAARRALTFLEPKNDKTMTLAEAFRTAYGGLTKDTGLPVLGLAGTHWIKDLLDQAPSRTLQPITQPADFQGTLRPYQLRGLEWMSFLDSMGIGACLADDMGLGKTIQLIALLLHERKFENGKTETEGLEGAPAGEASAAEAKRHPPTLLFAPTSVVGNWLREMQRFAPHLKVLVHHGPLRLRGDAFAKAAGEHDIVLTSYALAHRDFADLRRPNWHRLALDEAQKIKNPSAAATIAIRSIPAPHRIALTGTPIENHLAELWSIMEVLNPGLLGTAATFRERFAVPIEKLGSQERAAQLRKLIQPFVLRRTKTDPTIVGDLPDKIENRVYCNLTPEQAALYEATTAEMLGQIDAATGIRRRGLILAALTRLKQICDHPILVQNDEQSAPTLDARSGKCERLGDMLEEILEEPTDCALIFTQYRTMGFLLERFVRERLKQTPFFLHGGTPAKLRNEMVVSFQSPQSKTRIFILSLRAGGLGLNLTAANHVFHFDRWWNPAVEAQATDRAHRIGQTRKVQVHKFICVGTLEERIDRMLTEKKAVADRIVTSGDTWLTSLSTEELKNYLALSDDAVGDF